MLILFFLKVYPMLENSCLENAWKAVLIVKMAFILNMIPPLCSLQFVFSIRKEWATRSGER